jgi:very-short-patch-repair endonuclease
VLNFDAYDAAGRFLGCVDLAYPDLKIAIEYEGDHHWMTAEQFQRDIDRLDRLVENGWRIVRLTKRHVFTDPAEVVRRVSVARLQRRTSR